MLSRQSIAPQFTGGLEAARLTTWIVDELRKLRPKQLFFAYDTPDDYEPLVNAGKMLLSGGFTITSHALRCYVLCGYPKDTFDSAEKRMHQTLDAGFVPMAMLYRDKEGLKPNAWAKWQRQWVRPSIICSNSRKIDLESNQI
jgi:hypothetical protein